MTHSIVLVHQLMPTQLALIVIEQLPVVSQSCYRMIVAILAVIMVSPYREDAIVGMYQTPVSSLKALPRNLPCRPINDVCVNAEIRSTNQDVVSLPVPM